MGKTNRIKIARICLAGASALKAAAKKLVPGIIIESLSLPGWFILDEYIIKQSPLKETGIIGFEWKTYPMPNDWSEDMRVAKEMTK